MLNLGRYVEAFKPSSRGTAVRRPSGIGVRSAPTLRSGAVSPESRARLNIMRNLAGLSKTPSSSLLASIRAAHPEKSMIIVGIDGPTGMGRTQLCEAMLNQAEDVTVISASDFRKPVDSAILNELSSEQVFQDCFDWQRLRSQVLEPLSKGQKAVYRRAAAPGRKAEWVRVEPKGVILFEGVYTLRPELYPFYDYTVFVKPTEDSPVEPKSEPCVEDWYQDAYHPAAMADTLLEGDWF